VDHYSLVVLFQVVLVPGQQKDQGKAGFRAEGTAFLAQSVVAVASVQYNHRRHAQIARSRPMLLVHPVRSSLLLPREPSSQARCDCCRYG